MDQKRRDWSLKIFTGREAMVLFRLGNRIPILKRYIARQKVHHQRVTFQDEYRKFLKTYGIDYDERYVWD